ncbi:DNA-directed RNA polymerase I subunit RPA49-like [Branchiostoma lanceolatum]|uniref:DNA-directed RNA polymerase I subunit RPA49-like n=1 Tax=Branchiostoma lanceolatum TaxID=7740 RepID=UPI003453D3E5
MQYVGRNFGPSAPRGNSLCKYMVGVLDKNTGKMRVYDTNSFTMRPVIHDKNEKQKDEVDLTYQEKNDRLVDAFGGAKKKRAMESRLRDKVKREALETAMGAAVEDFMKTPEKLTGPEMDTDSTIPPHDKNAAKPEDVYKVESLISPEVFEALKDVAGVFVKATKEDVSQWRTEGRYSTFVLRQVATMPLDEEARLTRSCHVMYMWYLLALHGLKYSDWRKRDLPLPEGMPLLVKQQLLGAFTVKADAARSRRAMPPRLKDKLLCYILVMGLIIEKFKLNLNDIQKDLKIALKKLMTLTRAVGCDVHSKKADRSVDNELQRMAVLPIPLKLPDQFSRFKGLKRGR